MNSVNIKLSNGSVYSILPYEGRKVFDMFETSKDDPSAPVALYVNGALQGSQNLITCDADIRPVPRNTLFGQHVVRRSLVHLFAAAAAQVLPDVHVTLRHTIGYAWYFKADDRELTADEIAKVSEVMEKCVADDLPFDLEYVRYDAAVSLLEKRGDDATAGLLHMKNEPSVAMIGVAGFKDLCTGPVVPSTAHVGVFAVQPHEGGALLRYAHHSDPLTVAPWTDNPTLTRTHADHCLWANRLGIDTVGGLNSFVAKGDSSTREVIQLCDLNQERYITKVADAVPDSARLVLIAGPSSSGKTTFARKLCVHLRCRGLIPVYMGCDDFYLNHEETPRHPDGSFDFETIDALDLPFINDFLTKLIAGEEVEMPLFNFKTGKREWHGHKVHLPSNGVLVLEGIHGCNPRLTEAIASDNKFKIFISPVTSMAVSDRHRLSTSDNRMVRRMVRDFKYRAHTASHTLSMWESVRLGEDLHIYRFQNEADAVMNSGLNYELAVLRKQAVPLLRSVAPSDPGYADARRVLALLEEFLPIDEKVVPNTSILQEFLGVQYLFE